MAASVIIPNGADFTAEYPLNGTVENLIGRGSECQIQIDDLRASCVHAKFVFSDGLWMIIDSGSRNGTLVNRSKTDSAVLSDGDAIRIGDTTLVFHESTLHEQETCEQINREIPISEEIEEIPQDSGRRSFGGVALESLKQARRSRDLSDLHEFSLLTNTIATEEELVDVSLSILANRTGCDRRSAVQHACERGW